MDQHENVKRVNEEAKMFGVDQEQLDHLDQFLDEYWSSVKCSPFHVQYVSGRVGVVWSMDNGYLSVLFGPDKNWSWEVKIKTTSQGKYGDYDKHLSFAGDATFYLDDKPYYYLPDEAEAVIKVPDPFEKTYEPIVSSHQYRILWETDRYDGPLTGYCSFNRRLHYYRMVDETEWERKRMYAVYELTPWERFCAYTQHLYWTTTLKSKTLWKLWHWSHKRKMKHIDKDRFAKKAAATERFCASHKVVGYFSL